MQKRAFTLVELIVAISILSLIMVAVFEVYANIISLNKRLELDRLLQENSRLITETVAKDVRSSGMDFSYYDNSDASKTLGYTSSWASVLAINTGPRYYLMQESTSGNIGSCMNTSDVNHPCFFGKEESGNLIRLTDPRVAIESLHFFISGNSSKSFLTSADRFPTEGKVTLVFSIRIASGKWVDRVNTISSTLRIQTTISEKLYKTN